MSEYAEHYRKVAGQFTARVDAVPAGAWDNPAPCEGWVARDVVRHLVEWVPGFFSSFAGLELPTDRSVDDDPVAAWAELDSALRSALDDPDVAGRELEMGGNRYTVAEAIDQFCTSDIVVHTWDLARATGQDETLDPDEVHALFAGMQPIDEMLRESGHYGPRVEVPDDADEQTKLIAFTGRRP
ncbi:MAG: TIGR03086 family metal-binding protein [Acidimicrobiia bacterium]